ncbi:hypothetical protein R1flu_026805 [Riccia fluitans]|uniref:Uncharacterized protein n=1 Tax=Riccia fluitans TaxID=41844 RepID=A0ABD1XH03_9MARC
MIDAWRDAKCATSTRTGEWRQSGADLAEWRERQLENRDTLERPPGDVSTPNNAKRTTKRRKKKTKGNK